MEQQPTATQSSPEQSTKLSTPPPFVRKRKPPRNRRATGKVARLPTQARIKLAEALTTGATYQAALDEAGITNLDPRAVASWWRSPEAKRLEQAVQGIKPDTQELQALQTDLRAAVEAARAIVQACIQEPKPANALALQAATSVLREQAKYEEQTAAASLLIQKEAAARASQEI
ncbi:MAG: hypothetical protein C5B50_28830 [Verrucomicrobia bacterium]|nr:MAG: hypothetical protein C5B50_28830 [Verrucomicrobiota bacterium]